MVVRKSALWVAILILFGPVAVGDDAQPAEDPVPNCPRTVFMAGVGDVCRAASGDLAVYAPDGTFVGFTHGPDPVPGEEDLPEVPVALHDEDGLANAPWCVEAAVRPELEPRARVIYARAHNDADRYALKAPVLRSLVLGSNSLVHSAGVQTGTAANLKVECQGGEILVHEAVLPTSMGSASFSTIVNDLAVMGHNEGAVKFWIYYDDRGACSCGGMGNVFGDSTPLPTNLHNGWVPMYAVTFGYDSVRIMLHELGHNLGAVRYGAPHATGAGHCYDGRDTMCYNDGGPNAWRYSTGYCSGEVWDCGRDDYFNTDPAPGTYLAENWNIGSRLHRFLVFADTIDLPVVDVQDPLA